MLVEVHLEANIWDEEPTREGRGSTYLQGTEEKKRSLWRRERRRQRDGKRIRRERGPGAAEKEMG